jgi:hypothetical protein
VTGPLDRKAFSLWTEENATIDEQHEVLRSLATLKNGEAWVWAPVLGLMKRVTVRLRESFDSSTTPKPGQKIAPPKKLAEIDKGKLKGLLAAAVEKAKEEDPKALRQKVKDLEAQLAKAAAAKQAPAGKVELKRVEVPVLRDQADRAAERNRAQGRETRPVDRLVPHGVSRGGGRNLGRGEESSPHAGAGGGSLSGGSGGSPAAGAARRAEGSPRGRSDR